MICFFILKSIDIEKSIFDTTPYTCFEEIDLNFEKLEKKGNEISK